MEIVKQPPIEWLTAMDRLSIGAFYLLNVLFRKDMDVTDKAMMEETGKGLSSHRKHKKELIDCGYLEVAQVGRGKYSYTIKDTNGH